MNTKPHVKTTGREGVNIYFVNAKLGWLKLLSGSDEEDFEVFDPTTCMSLLSPLGMLDSVFLCCLLSRSRVLHTHGDTHTYVCHLCHFNVPHRNSDGEHPSLRSFLRIRINIHARCRAFGSGTVTIYMYLFKQLWQLWPGFEHKPSACESNALTK